MAGVDKKLKQRVAGAVVLTALAIVILPMLLDGSAAERARVLSRIPDGPDIQTADLRLDDVLQHMEKQEAGSEAKLSKTRSSESGIELSGSSEPDDAGHTGQTLTENLNSSLKLDSDGLPIAWSLQVGSFSKQENALKLRESLRNNEHQSYIYKAETETGETYRVFIGPVMNRTLLEAVAGEVKAEYDLEGRIVKYDTDEDRNLVGG